MSRRLKSEFQRTCNHCGRPVTNAGRPSQSGLYWCATNTACQNEKQKDYYARTRGIDRAEAPTECASCHVPLKPRKTRIDDVPGMRWCQRAECQRHRQGTLTRPVVVPVDPTSLEGRIEFLQAAAFIGARVTCPVCEVEDAVDGYPHVDGYGDKCIGTGERRVARDDVAAVWRDRYIVV